MLLNKAWHLQAAAQQLQPAQQPAVSIRVLTHQKIESESVRKKERLKDAPITVHHLQSSVFLSLLLAASVCTLIHIHVNEINYSFSLYNLLVFR